MAKPNSLQNDPLCDSARYTPQLTGWGSVPLPDFLLLPLALTFALGAPPTYYLKIST